MSSARMSSAFDYLEMARECMREADATDDPDRKKSLQEIAKLYKESAIALGTSQPPIEAIPNHSDS